MKIQILEIYPVKKENGKVFIPVKLETKEGNTGLASLRYMGNSESALKAIMRIIKNKIYNLGYEGAMFHIPNENEVNWS